MYDRFGEHVPIYISELHITYENRDRTWTDGSAAEKSAQAPHTDAAAHGRRGTQHFRGPLARGGHSCRRLEKNPFPNRADSRHRFCEGKKNLPIYFGLTV